MPERSLEEFLAALERQAEEDDEAERSLLSPPTRGAQTSGQRPPVDNALEQATTKLRAENLPGMVEAAAAQSKRPKFCRHCGAKLKPEGRFCTKCGQPIEE